jgi:hypothetical protein
MGGPDASTTSPTIHVLASATWTTRSVSVWPGPAIGARPIRVGDDGPVIVAVEGLSAAGKTTGPSPRAHEMIISGRIGLGTDLVAEELRQGQLHTRNRLRTRRQLRRPPVNAWSLGSGGSAHARQGPARHYGARRAHRPVRRRLPVPSGRGTGSRPRSADDARREGRSVRPSAQNFVQPPQLGRAQAATG